MRIVLSIAAFLTSIVVVPQGAQAAAPGNPCALLSLSEAQSITKFTLQDKQPNPLRADGGADKDIACTYMNDRDQSVTVMLHDDSAFFPGNAKDPNTTGFKAVKDLGDRAWSNGMAMAAAVYVLKNGRYVSVMVSDPGGLQDRGKRNAAAAMNVAKLVAKRM